MGLDVESGSGGTGTKVGIKKTSSGTTVISQPTVTVPSGSDTVVNSGGGDVELTGSWVANRTRNSGAGKIKAQGTVTVLASVGAVIYDRPPQFLDNFAGASIDPAWATTAGGGSVSQASDLLTCSFGTGVNAVLNTASVRNQPRAEINILSSAVGDVLCHIDSITLTTPGAGNILCGMGLGDFTATNTRGIYIARRRTSANANALVAENFDDPGNTITNLGSFTTTATTDLWFRIRHNIDDNISLYYRTSAPTDDDNSYTLLGTNTAAVTVEDRIFLMAWESTDSNGAVTCNFHKFQSDERPGPG